MKVRYHRGDVAPEPCPELAAAVERDEKDTRPKAFEIKRKLIGKTRCERVIFIPTDPISIKTQRRQICPVKWVNAMQIL